MSQLNSHALTLVLSRRLAIVDGAEKMRDLEAKENWLAARIDELLEDGDFFKEWCAEHDYESIEDCAKRTAEREHAAIMADLEEERINAAREY